MPTTTRVSGTAVVRCRGDLGDRLAHQRLELLPHPGHAGPHVAEAQPAAGQAHRRAARCRSGGSAAASSGWATRRRTPRSGPARRTRAGQQPGPAGAVEDAQHPLVGAQQRARAPARTARPGTGPRRAGRPPRPRASRPARRPGRARGARPPPSASSVGHGEVSRHGTPARRGPLEGDVAGVPRGRLLLLVGLVVLVEHHDPRPGRPPAPRPRPGCRPRWRRPRRAPSPAGGGPPAARPARAGRPAPRPWRADGHSTSRLPERPPRSARPRPGPPPGGSRSTDRGSAEGRRGERRGRAGTGGAGRGGGGQVRRRPARARPCAGTRPARPAQRHAAHSARSSSSGVGPRPLRLASGCRATPGRRRDADLDDPAADPAAVQRDAHHVPDAHLVPERRPGPGSRTSCRWPARPGGPGRPAGRRCELAQRPRADFRSSTRLVCSQVKSLSLRPKWP